jgi:hypothetical protein
MLELITLLLAIVTASTLALRWYERRQDVLHKVRR